MPRTISNHEMERRQLVAEAKSCLMGAIAHCPQHLTVMEWLEILADVQRSLIAEGLLEEWQID